MKYKIFIEIAGKYEQLENILSYEELTVVLDMLVYLNNIKEVIIQIYDEDMTYKGTFMQYVGDPEEYENFKTILKEEHKRLVRKK